MKTHRVLVVVGGDFGSDSLGGAFTRQANYGKIFCLNLPDIDATDIHAMKAAGESMMAYCYGAEAANLYPEVHVVNFVGAMDNGKIVDFPTERFVRLIYANLVSQFVVAKALIPLLKTYNGRFIQIGSNAGESGFTGMAGYCASKFGNQGLTQVMAKELAPSNVPVNIVNPCAFESQSSQMSRVQVEQFMEQNEMTEEQVVEMLTSRIPMKRLATNKDLFELLNAVLSAPRFMTGQAISLSGGMMMG